MKWFYLFSIITVVVRHIVDVDIYEDLNKHTHLFLNQLKIEL